MRMMLFKEGGEHKDDFLPTLRSLTVIEEDLNRGSDGYNCYIWANGFGGWWTEESVNSDMVQLIRK